MHALVIGGNGFIGSHLVDHLVTAGADVTVLDLHDRRYDALPAGVRFVRGDLNQLYLVREALAGVDVVYHLAWASIHEVANLDPAADITTNLIPTVHLLEAACQAGVRRFVFSSSGGTVYGPVVEQPILEDHPLRPVNAYGVNKVAVEKYIHMFHHLYGLDYAILRPSVPYGPRQNPLARQGAAVVFLHRVAAGLPLTIWGDGSVVRDYFYVSDLVSALATAGTHPLDHHRVFNLGGSEAVTLNELVAAVEQTVGRKAEVHYEPQRNFDAPHVFLDTGRAAEVLDWQPAVSLADGLARTWAWMRQAFELP